MPNITKSISPAKNFQQIWSEIDTDTRKDLSRQLVYELSISQRTVENWYKGRPICNEVTRKAVVKIIKKVTGIETDYRHIC